MSEEQSTPEEVEATEAAETEVDAEIDAEEAAAAAKAAEEKVVCYLSKRSVPKSETVEMMYNGEGPFRVQSHLVKF